MGISTSLGIVGIKVSPQDEGIFQFLPRVRGLLGVWGYSLPENLKK